MIEVSSATKNVSRAARKVSLATEKVSLAGEKVSLAAHKIFQAARLVSRAANKISPSSRAGYRDEPGAWEQRFYENGSQMRGEEGSGRKGEGKFWNSG